MKSVGCLSTVLGLLFAAAVLPAPVEAQEPQNYVFIPVEMNRMPTHFGPSTGPRRGPDGVCFEPST